MQGTGYRLIGAEAAFDATKELDNIRQLVARQPDGLAVLAASAEGAARGAAEAKRKGIPTVAQIWFPVSKEVDSAAWDAALQLDTDEGGKLTIDFIAKTQGVTEGKILEITGLDAQPFSEGYKQGLRKALKQYPGLRVVASQQGFYTADGAMKVLRPMLSAHPDAKVIIDYAAEMGNAISQELKRRNKTNIVHVTSDGNDAMIPLLKEEDGAYTKGDRWFSPGDQGVVSVKVLRARIENDEDPTNENIGSRASRRAGDQGPDRDQDAPGARDGGEHRLAAALRLQRAREQDPVRRLMGIESDAGARLIALRGLGKEYPGVRALDDVSFDIAPGSVHALVGENGAGKSTLIKLIAGAMRPSAGEIEIDGRPHAR